MYKIHLIYLIYFFVYIYKETDNLIAFLITENNSNLSKLL